MWSCMIPRETSSALPDIQNTREVSLRVMPANQVAFDDVQSVFGDRGAAARCQCQRYRLRPGESFGKQPVEERQHRLREQAGYGDPDAPTCGLVVWLEDEPAGWCAVGPRSDLDGLKRVFTVPWKGREEDPDDPAIWAVTCFYTRKGFRRRGIASALLLAAVEHARSQAARAVEGYPITRTDVINEELHVGTVSMFEEAGFTQVGAPTSRRLVMRIDF
jgi:GNAT superfamily N-acetyltransferase